MIDDALVNDDFMNFVLEMAVPENMKLAIFNVDLALPALMHIDDDGENDNIIVLVKSPITVMRLLRGGLLLDASTWGEWVKQRDENFFTAIYLRQFRRLTH
ncbi:PTS sugar transporter subunit IIB [Acerihabitans sp. KWT182]|uniref:PTS sugar transporter subunit IIB n=1 Tax=Acerihabitans sp. KWT182 TaxID=3157919 RepID=A0AAU7QBG0_9GAMM